MLDLSPSRLAAARATLERLRADAPPRHTAQAALAAHELAPLAGAGVVIASLHAPVYVWGVAGLRRVWRGDAGGVADAPPAIVAGATGLAPPPAQTIVVRAADVGGACGAVPSSARAATFARGCVVESMAIDFAVDARRCGGDAGAAAPPRAPHPHPHPPTSAAPSMALAHACNEGGAAGLADDGVAAGAAGLAPLPASAAARVSGRGGEAGAALLPPAPRGGHAARVRVLAELALAEADAAPPASARGGARGASWSRESRLALAELRAHAGTGERLDWRRMVAWRALQRQVL